MQHLKVGDWVRSTKYKHLKPIKIKSIYKSNTRPGILGLRSGGSVLYSDEVKLWIPEPDEWCWFCDYLGFTPTIGIYVKREEENFLADIPNGKGSLSLMSFKCCQPLIGELPSNLKGFNE